MRMPDSDGSGVTGVQPARRAEGEEELCDACIAGHDWLCSCDQLRSSRAAAAAASLPAAAAAAESGAYMLGAAAPTAPGSRLHERPVPRWTAEMVSEWARSQGRGEEWQAMADKLLEHEVDGDVLLAYEHCKHELRVHLVNHHITTTTITTTIATTKSLIESCCWSRLR